jgi:hypothetical protein
MRVRISACRRAVASRGYDKVVGRLCMHFALMKQVGQYALDEPAILIAIRRTA